MLSIAFLTQDDPVYILPFFTEFFRLADGRVEVVQLSCCRIMGQRSRRKLAAELLSLYGPVGMGRLLARSAAAQTVGRLPAQPGEEHYYSIEQACKAYAIRYDRIGNPNAPEFIKSIEQHRPDIIVSIACPYILKPDVLHVPPLGCINAHHAPLPRYKGMMPTFWQLYHGEVNVGLTIHYMNERIDEGQVLLQDSIAVHAGESLDQLIVRSKRHAAHCVLHVLQQIESKTQAVVALDQSQSTYFTFPTRDQIREFHRRGLRAI